MNTCNLTVIIPTYKRPYELIFTIQKIQRCIPSPSELIIHIDNNDLETKIFLEEQNFEYIKIFINNNHVGPGGGRNRAIAIAKNEIVASFDDDSYPIDKDYFKRLLELFEKFPEAAVIGAAIYHRNETVQPDIFQATWEHSFVGCGCAYRKSIFEQVQGYVPLPLAYGMEEVDLSLRLYDVGYKVLISPWLRVFHDTNLSHHTNPKITAASISNQLLLTYLRYPIVLWWIGIAQSLSRIIWLIKYQRFAGILTGLTNAPSLIYQNYRYRSTVKVKNLNSFLHLKRNPIIETLNEVILDHE